MDRNNCCYFCNILIEKLEGKFAEFDKEYNPYFALKEKIIAVTRLRSEELEKKIEGLEYHKSDLIIKLVEDYIKKVKIKWN